MSGLRLTLPPWQTRVDPHLCRTNKGEGMSPPYTKNRHIVLNRIISVGSILFISILLYFLSISLLSDYTAVRPGPGIQILSGDLGSVLWRRSHWFFRPSILIKYFCTPEINPFTRLVWRLLISTRIFLLLPGPMSNNLPSIKTLIAPFRLKRMVA